MRAAPIRTRAGQRRERCIACARGCRGVAYTLDDLLPLGRLNEATESIGKAISLDPSRTDLRGMLVDLRLRACEWSTIRATSPSSGKTFAPTYLFRSRLHRVSAFARRTVRRRQDAHRGDGPAWRRAPRNSAALRHGRIRIAYLSGELRNHATANLFVGVLERHDKKRFEVTVLNTEPRDDSPAQKRVVDAVEAFVDVAEVDDDRLVELHQGERDRYSRQSRRRQRSAPRPCLSGAPRAGAGQLSRLARNRGRPQLRLFHRRRDRHSAGRGEVVCREDRLSSRQLSAQRFEARDRGTRELATSGRSARLGVHFLLLQRQRQTQPRYVRRLVAHPPGLSRQCALAAAGQRRRDRQFEEGGGGSRRRSVSARSSPRGP